MTFEEIPLYRAIYNVRKGGAILPADPVLPKDRDNVAQYIHEHLPEYMKYGGPYLRGDMLKGWRDYRKMSDGKAELTVLVGAHSGDRCFWSGRVSGACTPDATLERLTPGKRGGEYTLANCVLACGSHNSARGDKTVEEFLVTK